MSKPTHTPGPWELRENAPYDTGGWVVFSGRGKENKTICRLPYGHTVPCPDTAERRENTANSRLIAAAPDMLEVLELEESLSYHPRGSRIPAKLETLWGQRFCEEFERGEPSLINDLYSLAIRLRRRAIAKAKGEAE